MSDTAATNSPAPAGPRAVSAWRDRLVIAGMSMMYAWSFYQRVAVPGVLFGAIQSDLQCSAKAITGLASIYLYIYAPGQFLTGYLADRLGGARLIIMGSLLLSVGALGFPLCTNLPALYAFRALVAVGATAMYLCTMRELASRFDAVWFSRLVGPVMFMGGLGGMMGTAPTAWLAQPLGWRGALLTAGALTAAASLGLILLLRRHSTGQRRIEPIDWNIGRGALTSPRLRPLYLTATTVFVCYYLFQAVIGHKFLVDVVDCDPVLASNLMLAMQLVSMLLMLFSGTVAVWFKQRRRPAIIAQVGLTLGGVALLLATAWLRLPLAAPAVALLMLGAANGLMPLSVCAVKEVSPPPVVAMVIAVCNGLTYVAVALVSNLSGMVLDAFEAQRVGDAVRYPSQAYAAVLAALLAPAVAAVLAGLRFREPTSR